MNYKVTRIGLLNFWYFDDEEFNFFDGRLLLRGGNGSGKSVTMQSFIPLILDGDKRPTRLDPFGTKEKRIEDYLLGPSDGQQKDDAIGYLYMETYNEEKDKYITVGMGLHARKGRPTDFWGFALKDGKRIGVDFELYKSYSNKVLMTKKELRANIGPDNLFTETAKEYKTMVNNLLFGFKNLDSYDEFINVLLQLRSSKLSKDYNPVKLMSILSSVLQPLTDEDIRPLSDAIEDTNKTKEKIDNLNANLKAISNLSIAYQNYNEINLYIKAKNVNEVAKEIFSLKKQITEKETSKVATTERLKQIDKEIDNLVKELIEVTEKLKATDDNDLKKQTEKQSKLKENIKITEEKIKEIKKQLETRFDRETNIQTNIAKLSDKIYQKETEINSLKEDIISLSDEVNLPDIILNIKSQDINCEYLEERIAKYKNKINEIKIKLEEKEKLEIELSKLEEENEKNRRNLNQSEEEKEKGTNKLKEEIDNFKDKLILLDKQSKVVKMEENTKRKIFDLINDYSTNNYILAKEEYGKEVKYFELQTVTEKSNLENKLKNEQNELKILKEELDTLKNTSEIEYIDENLKDAEEKLKEKNIPFIPLYKVIEFKNNVKEEDKNKIEELLISMNILNAKIVPNKNLKDIKNIKSVFLKQGTYKKDNISLYFDILENTIIPKEEIKNILTSISISDKESFYITPEKYEADFLVGYSSENYKSKYIGILKRKAERQKQIKIKEEEIETKEKIINNYKNLILEVTEKLENIKFTQNNFPESKTLDNIKSNITRLEILIDKLFQENKEIIDKLNKINGDIKIKIEEINKVKENITIPLNLTSYKNALMLIEEISRSVSDLKNKLENKIFLEEQKTSSENSLEGIRDDIDYQNSELLEKNKELAELSSKKKAIDEILKNKDYQELISQLKILTERKNKIPDENGKLREEKGKLENSLDNINETLENLKISLKKEDLKLELTKKILEKECDLKYIYPNKNIEVSKILSDFKNKENKDKNKAYENYNDAFNNYKQQLLDYRLSTKEIFSDIEELFKEYAEKGLEEKEITQILSSMRRQDLETIYQGKKLNLFELNACLKAAVEESENYISTQERYLFEDILLKTVGNKIRDKIESSREWVKKINNIMKTTQIDSNLSFELEWKSKVSFTEEELDTKELVRLFKIDAGQLEKKDSEKLITHFRSQIKKELEFSDKTNESYTNIIFKVLDYRNWFEFKLYYKRKSNERKELTNKVFSILSGGERAKSMYVPLFASVYAKLLNAKEDALRIIALDEAFAGVDNSNIREMFDILSQLNLDYILTSQALWGDYDTVKELSICELIKHETHKAVAVRHYKWNGHSKEILEKSDLYV